MVVMLIVVLHLECYGIRPASSSATVGRLFCPS